MRPPSSVGTYPSDEGGEPLPSRAHPERSSTCGWRRARAVPGSRCPSRRRGQIGADPRVRATRPSARDHHEPRLHARSLRPIRELLHLGRVLQRPDEVAGHARPLRPTRRRLRGPRRRGPGFPDPVARGPPRRGRPGRHKRHRRRFAAAPGMRIRGRESAPGDAPRAGHAHPGVADALADPQVLVNVLEHIHDDVAALDHARMPRGRTRRA